ncbi:hypothetical protein EIN_375060, partial [Entamoeba invadens IP1]
HFLRKIEFVDYGLCFEKLPRKKEKILQEDFIDSYLRLVSIKERKILERQFEVLVHLSCSDKKMMSRSEFVWTQQQLKYVTDKVGTMTNEVLMTCSFRVLDSNYTASIDKTDLAKFLKVSGMESKKSVVLKYIEELDENGDGVLQLDEILSILKIFVKNRVYDTDKYIQNLNAKTRSDLVDCKNVEKVKIPSKNVQIGKTRNSVLRVEKDITYDNYINTLKTMFLDKFSGIESVSKFLFYVGDVNQKGVITKERYALIVSFFKDNNCVVPTSHALYKVSFQLVALHNPQGIDVKELMKLCSKLEVPFSSEEEALNRLVEYDANRNGLVELDEFILMMFEDDEPKLDDSEEVRHDKEIRKYVKSFRKSDMDRDGHIDEPSVLDMFFKKWGTMSVNNQNGIHIAFLLYGKTGLIDENGFVQLLKTINRCTTLRTNQIDMNKLVLEVFTVFDANQSGIDMMSFFEFLKKFNVNLTEVETRKVFKEYSVNEVLTAESFANAFNKVVVV